MNDEKNIVNLPGRLETLEDDVLLDLSPLLKVLTGKSDVKVDISAKDLKKVWGVDLEIPTFDVEMIKMTYDVPTDQ